jgi:alkaline phosphatase
MSYSRRQFLARSGWIAASTVAAPGLLLAAGPEKFKPGRKPRHIIHLVADGMSSGTWTCADHFSRLVRGRSLAWCELYRRADAFSALVNMRSLNSLVTDSAAASSSWGSGSRVKNGVLNVLPDGTELRPLCSLVADEGWARGLVTTTEITHATPAGFAANVDSRGSADAIAVQYLERKIDVLLGGGRSYFDPAKRKDKRDLKADFRRRGCWTMETRADLEHAPMNQSWLGTFADGHLPFTLDQQASAKLRETVPTLAEMTRAALRRLESSRHFLLQVEGGRVDHGAHASDAAAALNDMLAFDEALEVCLAFRQRSPETLIVVTTDHGTGNLGLNGMGTDYAKTPECLANVRKVKKSFGELNKDLRKAAGMTPTAVEGVKEKAEDLANVGAERLTDLLEQTTGYAAPAKKAEAFIRFMAGRGEPLFDQMNTLSAQLGQLLANYLGIGWTGSAHTADYVPLIALGPGAERFRGLLQNTDIFPHYLALAGIRFRNPECPLLADAGPSAAEAERWELV